ncbi:MAG TPA: tRNA (adenosine(37)-N6)-threonylcarbamoyltransferase complex ATPase subunit type 1 TsaE [Desulfobacterales bacterium]|nr:tRNA (adenosine(37)-N6)-threonylcarbamoyltransferase complex ATPase subunit type 1 TsaE [Desulfobacterales bacterium]
MRLPPVFLITHSPRETQILGEKIAARLQPGDILLLHGDLGAGKTELVRGLAVGLGAPPDAVSSPTFALVHEYPTRIPLIHVDLYRLPVMEAEFILELEEYWQRPVVVVIEWAERLGEELPEDYLDITLTWTEDQERSLEIRGAGRRGKELAEVCEA